jgi:hypothetical protein
VPQQTVCEKFDQKLKDAFEKLKACAVAMDKAVKPCNNATGRDMKPICKEGLKFPGAFYPGQSEKGIPPEIWISPDATQDLLGVILFELLNCANKKFTAELNAACEAGQKSMKEYVEESMKAEWENCKKHHDIVTACTPEPVKFPKVALPSKERPWSPGSDLLAACAAQTFEEFVQKTPKHVEHFSDIWIRLCEKKYKEKHPCP